ncbi:hypothetical protein WR25_18402 [Diploscapter pachys]|uniref:U1-type domain-containing protein n=1 Tax=Diploscapter pachys TaxID=2018661 RepID=A0A2A2JZ52_9BILA|nr:hypothetical protein WR25_18402 [Diploscapter pachys]
MSFYEQSGSNASGTDHRRKWNAAEYTARAQQRMLDEREAAEKKSGKRKDDEPKVKKEMLQARDYKIDLESKIGKQVVINKTTPSAESGGFYCDVCDCVVKDSINFLDHINGKNHQRNMGMSMKVKKSTVDDVRTRLAEKRIEKMRERKEKQLEEMLEEVHEEEMKMQDHKREKKHETRKRKRETVEEPTGDDDLDPELRAMMGFSGFGTTSKK